MLCCWDQVWLVLWWCSDETNTNGLSQQRGRADSNCETDFPFICGHQTLVSCWEREILCIRLHCHWTTQQILPGDWITGYNIGPIKSKKLWHGVGPGPVYLRYDRVKIDIIITLIELSNYLNVVECRRRVIWAPSSPQYSLPIPGQSGRNILSSKLMR